MRRVVVTGLGIINSLGVGVKNNWEKLISGECGISSIETFDVTDLPAKIAGQIPVNGSSSDDFIVDNWIPKKDQRKMDEFIIYGLCAAQQAVEDSGWSPVSEESMSRTGVLIGSGIGGLNEIY